MYRPFLFCFLQAESLAAKSGYRMYFPATTLAGLNVVAPSMEATTVVVKYALGMVCFTQLVYLSAHDYMKGQKVSTI